MHCTSVYKYLLIAKNVFATINFYSLINTFCHTRFTIIIGGKALLIFQDLLILILIVFDMSIFKIHLCSKNRFRCFLIGKLTYVVFILFGLYSCIDRGNRESMVIIKQFPETVSLVGKTVNEIRSNFNPFQMGLHEDLLVFCDWENSLHFHLYQVPDFQYIGSFGQQGRGPGEFMDPVFWGQFENRDSEMMWVYQIYSNLFTLVDINESLLNQASQPEVIISVPSEAQEAVNIISLNDSVVLGSGYATDGEFFYFNHKSKTMQWQPFRTTYTRNITSFFQANHEYISTLKQGITKIKPDKTRFVKAMVYMPLIDVYKANGEHDFSILLRDFSMPDFNQGRFDPSGSGWYENIFLTDKHIYAINRNCRIQQYIDGECIDTEIHVFDWQGQPVIKYKLNEGIAPASPFVVDEEHQKIYIVNFKDSDDFFRVFDKGKNTHQ